MSRSLSLAGAAFVVQLPPGFGTAAAPPCDPSTKLTPARKVFASIPTNPPGRRLLLDGAVIGIRCGFVAGASVSVEPGRTNVITDAGGRYRVTVPLSTIVAAPSVYITVVVPKKTRLATSLFLPDEIAHAANAAAAGFDPLLQMKLVKQTADAIQATFNIILDL